MLQTIEFKFYKQVSNPIWNVHTIRSNLKCISPPIKYRINIQSEPIAIRLDLIKNIDNLLLIRILPSIRLNLKLIKVKFMCRWRVKIKNAKKWQIIASFWHRVWDLRVALMAAWIILNALFRYRTLYPPLCKLSFCQNMFHVRTNYWKINIKCHSSTNQKKINLNMSFR